MRRYWKVMIYGCDRCGRRTEFFLEDGCEGPRDAVEKFRLPDDHPFNPGGEVDWWRTSSGRLVLPVPFMAGGCPVCQPVPPWSMAKGAGVLSHVDWNRDRGLGPEWPLGLVPGKCGAFWYPKDPHADHACGVPIFPDELASGVLRPAARDLVAP